MKDEKKEGEDKLLKLIKKKIINYRKNKDILKSYYNIWKMKLDIIKEANETIVNKIINKKKISLTKLKKDQEYIFTDGQIEPKIEDNIKPGKDINIDLAISQYKIFIEKLNKEGIIIVPQNKKPDDNEVIQPEKTKLMNETKKSNKDKNEEKEKNNDEIEELKEKNHIIINEAIIKSKIKNEAEDSSIKEGKVKHENNNEKKMKI